MQQRETDLLLRLALCWNNLDSRFIDKILRGDCIFESQWVLTPIHGRQSIIAYLNSKFNAIRSAQKLEIMSVTAELGYHPDMNNKPCLVLTQIHNKGIRQVSILIQIIECKISRIDVCFIPDPTQAILTGEIPR